MTALTVEGQENVQEDSKTEGGDFETTRPSNEILPFAMDYLTPELIEEARSMLNETAEVRIRSLEEFRRLIKSETKLRTPTDEVFLLAFLRARKFNVKKAFKLLKNYWGFRSEFRSIFDSSNSQSVKKLIMKNFLGLLHFRDKKGCTLFIVKLGQWDPAEDSYDELFRTVGALLVYCIKFHATQVAGFRVIIDFRDLTWKQIKYCTPSNVVLLVRSTQFCFPARFKGVHVLSDSKLVRWLWSLVYPLLTSKLKKRVMFHADDTKPLLDYVDASVLPDELGGQGGPFENSKWSDIFDENANEILEMLNYGYRN